MEELVLGADADLEEEIPKVGGGSGTIYKLEKASAISPKEGGANKDGDDDNGDTD